MTKTIKIILPATEHLSAFLSDPKTTHADDKDSSYI